MSGPLPPPPPPAIHLSHLHRWEAVGTESNAGGGVYAVIQSCQCGQVRRRLLPYEDVKSDAD